MTLADLYNSPTEITHKGKTYPLRKPTGMERGMFQRWLEQRAREAAGRATDLPPEDQRQLLRDVTADCASGVYAWGGMVCVQALQSPDGIAKLYSIVLGVPVELAEEIVEAKQLECVAAIADVVGGSDGEKKALRQALVSLGLPADFLSASSSSSSQTPPSTTAPTTSPDSVPTN